MLHFAYSVRMVVGIGIYFRARGLSAGSMCMCHTRRLVGESINRTCDVVATEQVVLHKHGMDAGSRLTAYGTVLTVTETCGPDGTGKMVLSTIWEQTGRWPSEPA